MSLFFRTVFVMFASTGLYVAAAGTIWLWPRSLHDDAGLLPWLTAIMVIACIFFMLVFAVIGVVAGVRIILRSSPRWMTLLKRYPQYRRLPLIYPFSSAYNMILFFAAVYGALDLTTDKAFNVSELNPVDLFYFSVVTFATVGYGDIVATWWGRALLSRCKF
jgi:Ion channel